MPVEIKLFELQLIDKLRFSHQYKKNRIQVEECVLAMLFCSQNMPEKDGD